MHIPKHDSMQPKAFIESPKLIADLIIVGSFYAATGALAGHFFSIITPAGGAAFGAAAGFSSLFIGQWLDGIFGTSTSEKIVKFMGTFVGKVLVGVGVTLAIGVPLTMMNGVYLSLLMIPTQIITGIAFSCLAKIAE